MPNVGRLQVDKAVARAASVVRALTPWRGSSVEGVAVGFDDGDFEVVYPPAPEQYGVEEPHTSLRHPLTGARDATSGILGGCPRSLTSDSIRSGPLCGGRSRIWTKTPSDENSWQAAIPISST